MWYGCEVTVFGSTYSDGLEYVERTIQLKNFPREDPAFLEAISYTSHTHLKGYSADTPFYTNNTLDVLVVILKETKKLIKDLFFRNGKVFCGSLFSGS